MEVEEAKCTSGYGKPPWIFKGSALYQFHLVKADIARAIIPKEFRLVEAFGYTLGGFFLANYNESPFGSFDELVVIAGIVWKPPTSHAWAARVYVNSDDACTHGRKEFGLPSQVATFSKSIRAISRRPKDGLMMSRARMGIQVAGSAGYDIGLASPPVSEMNPLKWMGPTIKISLPSFSGHTEHKPQLLKYYCQIQCRSLPLFLLFGFLTATKSNALGRVRPTLPATIEKHSGSEKKRDVSISVMLSKPILALEFNCLKMKVEPPVVVSTSS